MRPLAGRQLGDEAAARDHAFIQRPVRGGVDDAEPVPQDPDGGASRVQGRRVRGRIDAAGHTAHDDDARPRDSGGEELRRRPAVGGMVPAADHPGGGTRQQANIPPRVQQRRRLRNVAQQGRKPIVVGEKHARPQAVELLEQGVRRPPRRGPHRGGGGPAESGERCDGAVGCLQRGPGALEGGRERAEPRGSDAWHLGERQVSD